MSTCESNTKLRFVNDVDIIAGAAYIPDANFVITVSADVQVPNVGRPSVGTLLSTI